MDPISQRSTQYFHLRVATYGESSQARRGEARRGEANCASHRVSMIPWASTWAGGQSVPLPILSAKLPSLDAKRPTKAGKRLLLGGGGEQRVCGTAGIYNNKHIRGRRNFQQEPSFSKLYAKASLRRGPLWRGETSSPDSGPHLWDPSASLDSLGLLGPLPSPWYRWRPGTSVALMSRGVPPNGSNQARSHAAPVCEAYKGTETDSTALHYTMLPRR